jgi:cytochrome c oxidase subunit II
MREPPHLRRILIAWAIVAVIATPIVIFVAAPGFPPGQGSNESSGQVIDNTVLLGIVTPVAALMVVFFGYVLTTFRQRDGEPGDGVAVRGDRRLATIWLVATLAIVLFLATFGTTRLFGGTGAGGGQGPNPIAKPSTGPSIPVQVIAQQWEFTYRWPTFGGVETPHLMLPVGRQIAFHVTSLDVIHSFWARQLGVKADANPGVDNVAFAQPSEVGSFDIRCAELCGLFHGHMFDTGRVVSEARFAAWIHRQQRNFAPATHNLPRYNIHYFPKPERRGG